MKPPGDGLGIIGPIHKKNTVQSYLAMIKRLLKLFGDRDRLMLELMARAGMRIGEVLELTKADVDGKKLRLRSPKSGRAFEYVYLPQKVARRLNAYKDKKGFDPSDRLFPMTYGGVWAALLRTANAVGVHVRPHDLRRFAATYASRSGVPIEIASKVILRHSNLATTQIYLGRVSDEEAFKWIEDINR